ncbi:flagellar hook capping FlgD N-terminal domain-containing protein [Clostridium oryzae]|uniref:Basal-body rod modification protein FlgD n=1 Tax=Clostridium oryzae TaxID=1450648 RepID=A0A1V4ITQ3_9CLOT|nr:flagellar hook capping FlgD N-terminal domain-containing protein [Clostridium oryzae]OPJ63273.1 flagellar basal body rod modification protein [Clostridium oryzae]
MTDSSTGVSNSSGTNTTTGTGNYTKRGTKIVESGSTLDKSSFLKILSAELSNQDPTQQTDSTQYVAQLAQFSSLEQMSNLNATSTFNAANNLIGKKVLLNVKDANGNLYSGIVAGATQSNGTTKLQVYVDVNGKTTPMEFNYSDVDTVADVDDGMNSLETNVLLFTASSLIGKNAEFTVTDSKDATKTTTYNGQILGVYLSDGSVKFNVKLKDTGETKQFDYSNISKVESA